MALSRQRQLRTMHLFAGAGGGILADLLLGHVPVCAVEIEEYPRRVLLARQRDGILPRFPIWDDVRTFDGKPWRGRVDIVAGGFPCQDISAAGKGAGIEGERSGLWAEMARIIGEVRPRFAFVENSPMLTSRGGVRVIADLATMGYVGHWGTLGGFSVGGCSDGKRLWIVAHAPDSYRRKYTPEVFRKVDYSPESCRRQFKRAVSAAVSEAEHDKVRRDPDELAGSMVALKAIGNGQNPIVAALAWRILSGE